MTLLRGLYAITPDNAGEPAHLAALARAAIDGGARLIQYRDKGAAPAERLARAQALLGVCRALDVALVINDDLELALAIGAHGVHLGRDDGDPGDARRRLGPAAILGVSCYADLERAEAAARAGASYVAFGRFFASATKPQASGADPALLGAARARLRLPLVAIGGITPHNGGLLISAGADLLAVVSGVFAAPDVTAAARAYTALFSEETPK
ncbi:MAG: thiamine phosphate synthase [Chromatiaceae bacterium]|nr:thiamine phosphate synthase [Chromatiaceae bacterium]